jgi:hypothetical protein
MILRWGALTEVDHGELSWDARTVQGTGLPAVACGSFLSFKGIGQTMILLACSELQQQQLMLLADVPERITRITRIARFDGGMTNLATTTSTKKQT